MIDELGKPEASLPIDENNFIWLPSYSLNVTHLSVNQLNETVFT